MQRLGAVLDVWAVHSTAEETFPLKSSNISQKRNKRNNEFV